MPALDSENPGVPAVASAGALLSQLLNEASRAKPISTIEPALNQSDFENLFGRVSAALASDVAPAASLSAAGSQEAAKTRHFAVIETAARDLFDLLIAATSIDAPEFVKMWNLLDILSILSDNGLCDPALLFWLVEELLDSQTIAGCRKIFDYLESRRERITAKHFKQKNLVILRSCNELLRRLSRAEDTAFCGRVFIFMFQSFPLGDRSSVNLRGEYHVENVTTCEPFASTEDDSRMVVDFQGTPSNSTNAAIAVSSGPKKAQKAFNSDSLYALFWSLQEGFSQPLKLFETAHWAQFKNSLDATMKAFQAIISGEGPLSSKSAESTRRDVRRKRDEDGPDDGLETFNPKYLTSRDLFELEISDVSFRRHVLVQALVILDFVLSQSFSTKDRAANSIASNKSVIYSDHFDDDNTRWANDMKLAISDYLKKGYDGPYFYRMVETVLARDKNWVFWKMASCPPIQKDPVSSETFNGSKGTVQRSGTSKRLRPIPMGAVSMDFLRDDGHRVALDNLQAEERYKLPDLDVFKKSIADDDFEINMPTNEQTKAAAVARRASKSWRALRIGARFKLAAFDKIDDPDNIDALFEEHVENGGTTDEETASDEDMPENRQPIVLTGPGGAGRSAPVEQLMLRHKGVFAPVVRHAVRDPYEGEVRGKSFHFVTSLEFSQLRDGDRLIEYDTRDGIEYGTSFSAVDSVIASGKVPLLELDLESAQFARDMDFEARYILIDPAARGNASTADGRPADAAPFDQSITHPDPEPVTEALEAYIYGR
ncbi:hypothetical protein CDD83_9656 [Cordyceps sp. RAO-2017]|nr:hypothetical protein CDD83_9656 [Cordyceps sp. RAO-2017]